LLPPSMPPPPSSKDISRIFDSDTSSIVHPHADVDTSESVTSSACKQACESVVDSAIPHIVDNTHASSPCLAVYDDQVVWQVRFDRTAPMGSPLFRLNGCSQPACLQLRPCRSTTVTNPSSSTYVLALRGWQPRECEIEVALFAGSETMSQRKWLGPVMDSDFSIDLSTDVAATLVCGIHYRVREMS
jgi:hypothetical protein